MRSISRSKLNTPPTTTTTTPTITHHSPWHTPIPYLFGALGAILGLIAFALLVLACSYWRLSWNHHHSDDLDNNNNKEGDPETKEPVDKAYEEKILVIMAGDDKPTFLATPVCPQQFPQTNRQPLCSCSSSSLTK